MRYILPSTLAALTVLAGCQQPVGIPTGGILPGDAKTLFGQTLKSWAEVDANNQVTVIGMSMPLAALSAAPSAGEPTIVQLRFPEVVQQQTFVNHLSFDYNPHGHPPANLYTVPHIDMHYFAMTPQEVASIDCSNVAGVTPDQIPQGYALLPPTKGECVPLMGFHASYLNSPELARENPQKFSHTFVLGYYGGMMNFIEPMVTVEFLKTKQNFSYPVPKPVSLGRTTRYPTTFTATYDAAVDAYMMTLTNFVSVR